MNNPYVGERHGRYTIIEVLPRGKHGQQRVLARCDCGNIKEVDYSPLKRGIVVSCGCYGKEQRAISARNRRKGNIYSVVDGIVYMHATNCDDVFLLDSEDLDCVLPYAWLSKNGYAITRCPNTKKIINMHRLIMGLNENDNHVVDHINHIPEDNRKCNLRVCDQANNCMNRCANNKRLHSKYKGVFSATNGQSFFSTIQFQGKQYYLGSFASERDAATAYDDAARQFFGEYAKTNFD